MTQKERKERSRREILRAATEEFGKKDYGSVTMDSICANHGISKGMMYHYFSGKDALFLACVGEIFRALDHYLSQRPESVLQGDPGEAVRSYFQARMTYFQEYPEQRGLFEAAVLHPPAHLKAQIVELRAPLRERNMAFLKEVAGRLPLRKQVTPELAALYLERIERLFWPLTELCREEGRALDLPTMLEEFGRLLDLILFGIAQQGAQEEDEG